MPNPAEDDKIYLCVEAFATTDTKYDEGDRISEQVYYYLQPNERENFQEI